ncbi:MAG: glycoside hydrolase family 65 protein, partial [Thermodesulfobacteriota bacterium]
IYPPDPWKIVETRFSPKFLPQTETIFSTSNGYLGIRGVFEEGQPVHQNGIFINGFYETWPITYVEEAFGFAKTGQTIVNLTDSKIIKLYVDDEPFYLPTANIIKFNRSLDMRAGTLDREIIWEMASGKKISIKSRRLVSYEHRHLAAISYEVTVLNAKAPVVISSEIINNNDPLKNNVDNDPRIARRFEKSVLESEIFSVDKTRIVLCHRTSSSNMTVASGIEHSIETECENSFVSECSEDFGKVVFSIDAEERKPIHLTKYITYHTTRTAPHTTEELTVRAKRALNRAKKYGFQDLLRGQKDYLDDFWNKSDIEVALNSKSETISTKQLQQAVRFSLFQIFQATVRVEGAGVPSKGLTGEGYEGHYFWDMDIYLMPFLIHTSPLIARNLLKFRYSMLDEAREYAKQLNQKGAMFPWRTINGKEASAYYAAGTAQYHINADIVYALRQYVNATGDNDFLFEYGAEILVETARLWHDIGFYSERNGKEFHIHGVTGPDEYNTVVNNNVYTNLMARENLRFAIDTIESIRSVRPDIYEDLVHKTNLKLFELDEWKTASDSMYIPYDEALGIHPQDDDFLNKEKWDFKNTPAEKYPLLLNYHPLVIYRRQVIKQADLILAMFLLDDEFTEKEKKNNFDYYDPLTTGDSSLSVCIQSIMASKVGYMDKAFDYAKDSAFMDLQDIGKNVKDGCHIASMGGTWMLFVFGFAGFKNSNGIPSFNPRLPRELERIKFSITVRDNLIEIDINQSKIRYSLKNGKGIKIKHLDTVIELTEKKPTNTTALN